MTKTTIIRKTLIMLNILLIIGLGCLFVYAAATKVIKQASFQSSLENSPLVASWSVAFIGWGVPVVCLLAVAGIGYAFFRPTIMRWALLHYLLWVVAFTLYIILILTVADYKPCSCIGLTEYWTWEKHLVVNGFILIVNILVLSWPFRYDEKNLKIFVAADEAPSQPLKNGKYLKRKEV